MQILRVLGVAMAGMAALSACHSQPRASSTGGAPASPEALATHGRAVYASACTACHNANPAKPGSLGPEIQGASRALLEARILRAAYPEGYAPKRKTHLMTALPHLANDIDALAAFLNQAPN